MKNKGPLILFIFLVVIIVIAYFGRDFLFKEKLKRTSDATGDTEILAWAGDGYLGYSFLRTVEMKKQLAKNGLSLKFTDDNGDYNNRLEKFANKEYDFIVLPVNSYIEHGLKHKFPGVIVGAICESNGADAILGFEDVMPNNKVNDLNNPDLQIYYTPASPSSFLLDLTISDFALDELRDNKTWRREANGSEDVYQYAKKATKDRSIGDVFVMWEPEVTKAIDKLGMKKLWGSDQFAGYIIDVFVFHRDIVAKKPEKVKTFLQTYFRVLSYYNSRKDEMADELGNITSMKDDVVESMIDNIKWYSLTENCSQLFDIPVAVGMPSNDGLINSIYACNDVLYRSGAIHEDLEDPYKLVNSSFLESLNKSGIKSVGSANGDKTDFKSLSESEWMNLSEIGTMRVKPITFQSGTSQLDYSGEEIVDKVAQMLITNYPNHRVLIRGHTGQGDEKANKILSQERANVVMQRLIAVHNIVPNRLFAKGEGASKPPVKRSGENIRAYYLRWARVEFVLMQNNNF
jgi:outer membrane protein OmpA-like peptidoglycan-associated protein/ABC-type nitrate/sulfonate/bicarbonate transport system substrate-binding protein